MTEKKELTAFEKLCERNVNDYTEKKNGLTYLSWTYAWKEFKKAYPEATYTITHWDGKPYWFDENLGYMVETTVSIHNGTLSMWLPVMDGANKAQKAVPYTYKVKKYIDKKWTGEYEDKTVEPATMFDINTTIMRCLVKNIAMFGLGLYIYAGEDLPELSETTIAEKKAEENAKKLADYKARFKLLLDQLKEGTDTSAFANYESIDDLDTLIDMGKALKKIVDAQGVANENI